MSEEQVIIDEFEQIFESMDMADQEMFLKVLGIFGVIFLAFALFAVVSYVLKSIGLYTIAKRRGIRNPWLAWLPVCDYWIVGSISDQYQYVAKSTVKNKRSILLALNIVSFVISGSMSLFYNGMALAMAENISINDVSSVYFASSSLIGIATFGLSIAIFVFWHMSLYDLYSSCKPNNNLLFLLLGIFLPFLVPFFIFACRNKEEGMPPRREEPRYEYQPNSESRTYQDPWENV